MSDESEDVRELKIPCQRCKSPQNVTLTKKQFMAVSYGAKVRDVFPKIPLEQQRFLETALCPECQKVGV